MNDHSTDHFRAAVPLRLKLLTEDLWLYGVIKLYEAPYALQGIEAEANEDIQRHLPVFHHSQA